MPPRPPASTKPIAFGPCCFCLASRPSLRRHDLLDLSWEALDARRLGIGWSTLGLLAAGLILASTITKFVV